MKRFFESLSKTETRGFISIITVIGAFLLVALLMVVEVPQRNERILDMSLGILLGACAGAVYQFHFGTSKNESDKISKDK